MTEWWRNIEARPIAYDLGPAPDMPKSDRWRVKLIRGRKGWKIEMGIHNLGKSGEWSLSTSHPDQGFIEEHRWPLHESGKAIAFYKAWLVDFMEKKGKGDGDE